jgi:putative addiction module component (TIGR02574 family)
LIGLPAVEAGDSTLESRFILLRSPVVIVRDVPFAEEALSLPASERAGLVRLLVDSLDGEARSNEEIRADLQVRLEKFHSGADQGMTFDQVFGEAL